MSVTTLVLLIPIVSAFQHHHSIETWKKPTLHKHFSVVDISEYAPRDIGTMEQWAYACGVQRAGGLQFRAEDALELNDNTKLDMCVMTTEDIPAATSILYVPGNMILSSTRAIEEFGRLQDAENDITEKNSASELRQYYLMLKILAEWEKGDQSPWYHWLNSLPRFYSNAASMTHLCYTCLPTLMALYAMKERSNMNNLLYKDVPFLSYETKTNTDLWVWAYQVVYTRSFEANDGTGDLRIVPVADYFNHGTETNIAMGYDQAGNFHVQTTRDVPAGSPLHMSYGCPTNPSFLFARYGFLDKSSPATFCKLIIQNPNEELKNLGYAYDRMLFYKDTGAVSQEVWDVLLYKYLEKYDIDIRREFYKAHMSGDTVAKQNFHNKYGKETIRKLMFHVNSFLDTLEELNGKISAMDVKDHPRAPLILRHNQFVRDTFLAVKNVYDEYAQPEPVEAENVVV